jgi:hypothetical protein
MSILLHGGTLGWPKGNINFLIEGDVAMKVKSGVLDDSEFRR